MGEVMMFSKKLFHYAFMLQLLFALQPIKALCFMEGQEAPGQLCSMVKPYHRNFLFSGLSRFSGHFCGDGISSLNRDTTVLTFLCI